MAQGCAFSDDPEPRAGHERGLAPQASPEAPAPQAPDDPDEDRVRAALEAADAAREIDGDELTSQRAGASRGVSLAAACDDPLGSFDYCSSTCLCSAGEGDCDDDGDCAAGLDCMRDTGALFGFDPEVDFCMEHCSADALGTPDFCSSECPCESGQGDCDRDSDCAAGNVCAKNVGASFGFAADVDVCVDTCDPVRNGTFDYCSPACPCEAGQGDCDRDADCAPGHVCANDVGAEYGFDPEMDVCVAIEVPEETFTGRVIDERGSAVPGATVSVNQVPVVTAEDGSFALSVPPAADGRYVINVEKFGIVPYSSIHDGGSLSEMFVTVAKAEMITLALDTTDIEDSRGTRIALSVPAQEALVDANGEPPRGPVVAQMHTFDVVGEGMVGNMDAVDANGNFVTLQSVGAVSVDFVDLEGNKYQLRPGRSAQIAMEVPPEIGFQGEIDMWHYDMAQGRWVEEGDGLVQDGMAFATVEHFSAWNFDVKLVAPACIKVTTTGLSTGESFQARITIPAPSPFRRSQIVILDPGDNVLYNLPVDTDVEIRVPPDALTPIVPPVDSGGPYGRVGLPASPDDCRARVTLPAMNGHIRGLVRLQGRTDHKDTVIRVLGGAEPIIGNVDEEGHYVIANVPPRFAEYQVELSYPGYLKMVLPVKVDGGKVHHLPCVVLPAGDVDEDFDIDFDDQLEIQARFGPAVLDDPADLDNDGFIGAEDVAFILPNLGKAEPLLLADVQCPSGNVASVAAGSNHTCTLMSDGRVRCWGASTVGQLGYGSVSSVGDDETLISVNQSSMNDSVAEIAAGGFHTCAVVEDAPGSRNVRCWGYNVSGQLGYGDTNDIGDDELSAGISNVSVGPTADNAIAKVAAGLFHTCVLTSGGQVHCWGQNDYGQLGYGHTDDIGDNESAASAGAVNVGGNTGVVQIAAGAYHTCVVLAGNRNVKCWGNNQFGQLGYGHTDHVGDDEEPASVTAVTMAEPDARIRQLVAGFYHTCARFDTGHMRCWGAGSFGQLGYGNRNNIGDNELGNSQARVLLANTGDPLEELAAGGFHTCARINNAVKCWGRANFGQLGYGSFGGGLDRLAPPAETVELGTVNVTGLAAGVSHTCAKLSTGNLMCWGRSNAGQLGYGNTDNIGDDELPSSVGTVPFLD